MTLETTSKLTRALIIIFALFIPLNFSETVMGIWRHYIAENVISSAHAEYYYLSVRMEMIERFIHFALNMSSLILIAVWMYKVHRIMRIVNADFKANRVMVYLFWIIPVYTNFYLFAAFRKIIRVGSKHEKIAKRMTRMNQAMLICYCGSYICLFVGLWIAFLHRFDHKMTDRIVSNALFSVTTVFGIIVSIFTIIFFRNYLKLERKLVSDYLLEPELKETGLIDG